MITEFSIQNLKSAFVELANFLDPHVILSHVDPVRSCLREYFAGPEFFLVFIS